MARAVTMATTVAAIATRVVMVQEAMATPVPHHRVTMVLHKEATDLRKEAMARHKAATVRLREGMAHPRAAMVASKAVAAMAVVPVHPDPTMVAKAAAIKTATALWAMALPEA